MKKVIKAIKDCYKDYAEFLKKHKFCYALVLICSVVYGMYVVYFISSDCWYNFVMVPKATDDEPAMTNATNLGVE